MRRRGQAVPLSQDEWVKSLQEQVAAQQATKPRGRRRPDDDNEPAVLAEDAPMTAAAPTGGRRRLTQQMTQEDYVRSLQEQIRLKHQREADEKAAAMAEPPAILEAKAPVALPIANNDVRGRRRVQQLSRDEWLASIEQQQQQQQALKVDEPPKRGRMTREEYIRSLEARIDHAAEEPAAPTPVPLPVPEPEKIPASSPEKPNDPVVEEACISDSEEQRTSPATTPAVKPKASKLVKPKQKAPAAKKVAKKALSSAKELPPANAKAHRRTLPLPSSPPQALNIIEIPSPVAAVMDAYKEIQAQNVAMKAQLEEQRQLLQVIRESISAPPAAATPPQRLLPPGTIAKTARGRSKIPTRSSSLSSCANTAAEFLFSAACSLGPARVTSKPESHHAAPHRHASPLEWTSPMSNAAGS
ncbi:hypothetical protein SDRG_11707 [Saprolegnia diclina VS20]|uniref:Uncharacterized protein n=1 Tax=Saprolegnia diclina (strain VS20) TaxID=1156394 RepID=T0RL41_SAPDV|nr:hypothetical protein SDRG_11707 [Saprolegnia diclina VS20]EQC30652.1 hypothetical protein SDRG_11707 [Saprolegnia diclina VS20]|eukprot:XP_008615978.1 hypothetical protein SDRG_11707 [Saprolegnia diclina VS20]